MKFISTRGHGGTVTASEAIIRGLAEDGGLYVPQSFPKIYDVLSKNTNLSYEDLAFQIIPLNLHHLSMKSLVFVR